MKSVREIEDKLNEATKEFDNLPWWDTEEKSAAGGAVAALAWVLGKTDKLDFHSEED